MENIIAGFPEILRMIVKAIPDYKSFASLLLTQTLVNKKLSEDDKKEMLKKYLVLCETPKKSYKILPNGKRFGKYTRLGKELTKKGKYYNGKREGLWIKETTDRRETIYLNYSNNLLEGSFLHIFNYDDREQVLEHGYYLKGEKTGLWKKWDEDGNLLSETNSSAKKMLEGISPINKSILFYRTYFLLGNINSILSEKFVENNVEYVNIYNHKGILIYKKRRWMTKDGAVESLSVRYGNNAEYKTKSVCYGNNAEYKTKSVCYDNNAESKLCFLQQSSFDQGFDIFDENSRKDTSHMIAAFVVWIILVLFLVYTHIHE